MVSTGTKKVSQIPKSRNHTGTRLTRLPSFHKSWFVVRSAQRRVRRIRLQYHPQEVWSRCTVQLRTHICELCLPTERGNMAANRGQSGHQANSTRRVLWRSRRVSTEADGRDPRVRPSHLRRSAKDEDGSKSTIDQGTKGQKICRQEVSIQKFRTSASLPYAEPAAVRDVDCKATAHLFSAC